MRVLSPLLAATMLLASCAPSGEEPGPRLSAIDRQAAARYRAWQQENAMPAVILTPAGAAPATAGGTRLGGPVWLAKGEPWPVDRSGKPMVFLAQVDFATVPHLEDYPEHGVLQFFLGRSMTYGADFEHPGKGDFKVIWRPDFAAAGALHRGEVRPGDDLDDLTPIEPEATARGVALKGEIGSTQPTWLSWQFANDLPDIAAGKGRRGLESAVIAQNESFQNEKHHIGGHPEFTQDDWRGTPELRAADRVLLNLWSDRAIMWGDAGQGQFMIRRTDLLKRDFSRVYYSWDCS